ncbi:hypothetical protein EJ02DRAFT_422721 [Clathrospora elynae]|uniref:Cyanovirin-N domain-containing protein n=1 Tax=Clathrospora elynae TaxID=706981 RepID=A0A6A5SPZ7_9PLEO|nr:hypothetical protein EJ02DRAFT_422721 [Clathrospora elynae]
MRLSFILATTVLGAANWALAGHNCKCQDTSTGTQWNALTEKVCIEQAGTIGSVTHACGLNIQYHGDQSHQCSSSLNCLDSGAFVDRCRALGTPGAYCWN